jgi:hypothetical protein
MTEMHGGHGTGPAPFTENQLEQFHADDRHGGGAVVVLMTAIFTIGLILYSIVLGMVLASPHSGL